MNTDVKLNLSRPVCFFDLETTGLTIGKDRIVEIAVIKVMPDGSEERLHLYVDPEIPIPPESSAVHGLTIEKLRKYGAKPLNETAQQITDFIGESDLAGFNSNKFDIPLLVEELNRVGAKFDLENRFTVDVQNIFHKMEQRTLSAACKFYLGKKHEDAHSAMADTEATLEVLKAQLVRYADVEYEDKDGHVSTPIVNDIKALSEFSTLRKTADLAGRIGYDDQGMEIFNFGQHKGKRLREFFQNDPGGGRSYVNWILGADFPEETKHVVEKIYRESVEPKTAEKPVEKNADKPVGKPVLKSAPTADQLKKLKEKFNVPTLFD